MRKPRHLLSLAMLVGLTALSLNCAANKPIVFYPIQDTDFYRNDKGDYCMTEFYLNEVLEAKIGRLRR